MQIPTCQQLASHVGSQNPYIVDSGASNHICGNTSLFSSLSFPKNPHFIILTNGFKVSPKGSVKFPFLLPQI